MRWKKPKYEETRVKEKFLWFPLEIGEETRWLEKAYWEEKACYTIVTGINFFPHRWLTFTEYYYIKNKDQE